MYPLFRTDLMCCPAIPTNTSLNLIPDCSMASDEVVWIAFTVSSILRTTPRLTPLEGLQSMWCGAAPDTVSPIFCGYADLPGYGNNWAQTFESGDIVLGEPGTGSLGLIQSGALEASNVDIATSLVKLITSQRNFQANAQVISTADTVTQTIINI